MKDTVLTIGTSLVFLLGWFLMKRLGCFLEENQKRMEEAAGQQPQASCVRLDGDISPDELKEVFSRFHISHTHVEIMIYDPEHFPSLDNESDPAR